jgi:hypothetical protein
MPDLNIVTRMIFILIVLILAGAFLFGSLKKFVEWINPLTIWIICGLMTIIYQMVYG